ncbi:MAG: DUF2239 family protein [Pseudoxanthomonas sp.]
MSGPTSTKFVVFDGTTLIAEGGLERVAVAASAYLTAKPHAALLVLDLTTGSAVDLDLRGTADDVVGRLIGNGLLGDQPDPAVEPVRGRPKLGVVAREVTLLPRHWDWLSSQRGGASAALRRLVDEARQRTAATDGHRARQEAAYRAMTTLAGDLAGYESAIRALFASDVTAFESAIARWPTDIQRICQLLWPTQRNSAGINP